MPYGFEIRTKEGELIRSRFYTESQVFVHPRFSLKDAIFFGRQWLEDEKTPKGSKLKIFKIIETRYTYKKR